MSTKEAIKRAILKYDSENTVQIHLKLNRKTDADLLVILDNVKNKQGLIKEALREYVKGGNVGG